jgi:multiple sugar transport system permease protein
MADRVHRRGETRAIRVDEAGGRARTLRSVQFIVSCLVAAIMLIPVVWVFMTAFKTRPDAVAAPPKIVPYFQDGLLSDACTDEEGEEKRLCYNLSLEGLIGLFSARRTLLNQTELATCADNAENWIGRYMCRLGQVIIGPSPYVARFRNSIIIAGTSTVLAVTVGLLGAYSFSRFEFPGKGDIMGYILGSRMAPAAVGTISIFLMYRALGWNDSHIGMIFLYTVFNLSLSVWILKGFIDEIPREYEEAAMVDGYSRLQAFFKIVLPQSATGIAATTVFCLVFAWNEYIFSLMLTQERARTAPVSIPAALGSGGMEWGVVAAGGILFVLPVVVVTFALRKYLLRGVTFGAIRG